MKSIDQVYDSYPEDVKSLFLAIRSIILGFDDHLTEEVKYGAPCFLYKGKIIIFLMYSKSKETYLLLSYGKYLKHDLIDFKGRKSMQLLMLDVNNDIPIDVMRNLFVQLADAVNQKKKLFNYHQTTKKRS